MRKKRKTIKTNICELCGSELEKRRTIFLKDYHVICFNCLEKYKRKGDKFNLTKMDITIYEKRKNEEEMQIEEANTRAEELIREKERKLEEEKRSPDLPEKKILDDILLIGNRTNRIQEAINLCEEGDPVTIDWELLKDEDGIEYSGEMLIVIHDYSGREIGRFKEEKQKELVELGDDYLLDGSVEKIGRKENGELYIIIKIIAELKIKT